MVCAQGGLRNSHGTMKQAFGLLIFALISSRVEEVARRVIVDPSRRYHRRNRENAHAYLLFQQHCERVETGGEAMVIGAKDGLRDRQRTVM